MGSVYRKTPASKRWHVAWKDESGRRRVRAAFTDRRLSRKLLADLERAVMERRAQAVDPFHGARARPLADHIAAYADLLESRGCTLEHVRRTTARLGRAFEAMGACSLDALDVDRATRFLARLRSAGRADTTRNSWLSTLRGFGRFLVRSRRLRDNPFELLARQKGDPDPRRVRMPLSADQLELLVARTREHAPRRALLYRFAALTGLRANECRQLRFGDLVLGADPHVVVQSRWAKNRRRAEIPLAESLAAELRAVVPPPVAAGPQVAVAVFVVPARIAAWLRRDAERAGIAATDAQGRVLDFHSLRVSTATLLARAGVAPAVAQRILRHHDPKLTMKHYTRLAQQDLRVGVERLGSALAAAAAAGSRGQVAGTEAGQALPASCPPAPAVTGPGAARRRFIGAVRGLGPDVVRAARSATSPDATGKHEGGGA